MLETQLKEVEAKIQAACDRAGRKREEVTLIAVSKTKPIEMLQEAYKRLNRYPKKSDFTVEEVAAIKSFLGPWPRALEAGGILPDRSAEREAEKKQKRIAAKRRQTQYKIERQKNNRKDETVNEDDK